MDRVVLLDTETSDLGDSAQCIEVAAILYSVQRAAAVRSFSSLIRAESNPAHAVNGISEAMLAEAPPAAMVWPAVARMIGEADAIVAHNAEFDRRFVPVDVAGSKPWICSHEDLQWPAATKPRMSLVALALAHGLGVSHAHRAMVDCDLLSRLLTRIHETGTALDAFLARGLRPKARFVVTDRKFDEARNEAAKAAGFLWDKAARDWWRVMAVEDAEALPFKVKQAG